MVVDWTGTNPQVKGAINNTLSFTKAASYSGIRSVLPPGIPNNEGVFRAIEVICPPGTVGNGVLPAACAARGLTGFRMDRLHVRRARHDAARQGQGGGRRRQHRHLDRRLRRQPQAVHLCRLHLRRLGRAAVGRRARRQQPHVRQHGLALDRGDRGRGADPALAYEFVADKAGAGKYRGGVPFSRDYRFLEDGGRAAGSLRPPRPSPFGLYGGSPGAPSENYLNPQARTASCPASSP
jgi:N-methylhydantoinase B